MYGCATEDIKTKNGGKKGLGSLKQTKNSEECDLINQVRRAEMKKKPNLLELTVNST